MAEVERSKVPEGEKSKVPEVERSKVPEVERSKVPEVERSKVPEVERSEVPEVERSKVPEAERTKVSEVTELLLNNESLFNWEMPDLDVSPDMYMKAKVDKTKNISELNDFKWHSYVVNLLLAYEWCDKEKNYEKAIEHIEICIGLLEDAKNTREAFYCDHVTSLWHITQTTRVQILLAAGKKENIHSIIEKITPMKDMDSREKAGVLGIKASVFLQYTTKGHRNALEIIKKAIDLNPNEPEWWFILGKALGRIRRVENGKLSDQEINAIKKAYELRKDNSYRVHLATVYADYSKDLFVTFDKKNIDRSRYYAQKAVGLFKETLEMQPDDQFLKARVAHSLIRIRFKDVIDIQFIKKLLDEVIVNVPNNAMAFHDLGTYYEKFENNSRKALMNLEKSIKLGNEKALLSSITLKWKHGQRDTIIRDLKEALDQFKGDENQAELLVKLGMIHLILEDDWTSGLDCLCRSLELDPKGNYLENFRGFKGYRTDTLQIIVNKLRLKIREDTNTLPVYLKFIDLMKKLKPTIFYTTPKSGAYEDWKRDQLGGRSYRR